jgi:hypothetical protein
MNASTSYDPDGAIVSYSWTFGDGTSGSGVSTSHAFGSAGTYTVTLTVRDLGGATASTTRPVVVSAPSASLPTGTVELGGYTLKIVNLLKCVSDDDRPYTAMIIRLPGQKAWLTLPRVLIDSGADCSQFPTVVAEALGLNLATCRTVTAVGIGGAVISYMAEVELGFIHLGGVEEAVDGYILGKDGSPWYITALVSFAPGDPNQYLYLLGRQDVFSQISLEFAGNSATIRLPDK